MPGITLAEPGRNCWQETEAERFGWAIDGADYFQALRESFEAARREILIVGWDIDSRVELIRDPEHPFYPSPLCETLQALVEQRDELSVHVLSWDFAMLFVLERELLPAYSFGWQESERLHFHLDGKHATGASHHQKIVIIDGKTAFLGGFDITRNRWDTSEHAPDDERRTDPYDDLYQPFHDIQAVVSGAAAAKLRELVDARWINATGSGLPKLAENSDEAPPTWPRCIEVASYDTPAVLARTWAEPKGGAITKEVEALFLDMIGSATRSIYIENQYFTSASIARALASSLKKEEGPEIVIVLPGRTAGWLEQSTMDVLRNRVLTLIERANRHDRLRIVSPIIDKLGDARVNVHAKIMVVDMHWLRIGSANLSGRSMGLDSECDLLVDGGESGAALRFVSELLAEHLGQSINEVACGLEADGLNATLDRLNGGPRRLEPLTYEKDTVDSLLESIAWIADLEKPIERIWSAPVADEIQAAIDADGRTKATAGPGSTRESGDGSGGLPLAAIGAGIVVLLAAAIAVFATSGDARSPTELLAVLEARTSGPLAPFVAGPVFALAATLFAPVTWLIALSALLFEPVVAAAVSIFGTAISTIATHRIGVTFAGPVSARLPAKLLSRVEKLAAGSDTMSMVGLRLLPIAPFAVVNIAVGIAGVALRHLLAGSLIAMIPGIVFISFSIDRARAALRGEPVFEPWIAVMIVAAGVGIIALKIMRDRRRDD